MIYNIDPEMALASIVSAIEEAGATFADEQVSKIVKAVDNAIPGVIQVIGKSTLEFWRSEAQSRGGWGAKYAAALKASVTGTSVEIGVDSSKVDKTSKKPNVMFAEFIENGMKSFSISDGLLASEKAKVGKDGVKYIVVPFPVAAPKRPGSGKLSSKFGGRQMTQEIQAFVKSGGKIKSGGFGNFEGLAQVTTRQFHSQYMMFRVASSKGKNWQHPGAAPDPVFPDVVAFLNTQIQKALSEVCRAIVKQYG